MSELHTAPLGRPSPAAVVSPTGHVSEEMKQESSPVTYYPGVMHTGAQVVIRNGASVLTDTPLASDDSPPGKHITAFPTVW